MNLGGIKVVSQIIDTQILHLMYQCRIVHRFWTDVHDFFIEQFVDVPIDVKSIIFGIHKKPIYSVENFIILIAKQYIWNNKFREPHTPLSIAAFKNILKSCECFLVYEF